MMNSLPNLFQHLLGIDAIAILFPSLNPFVEFILVEVELVSSFVVGDDTFTGIGIDGGLCLTSDTHGSLNVGEDMAVRY